MANGMEVMIVKLQKKGFVCRLSPVLGNIWNSFILTILLLLCQTTKPKAKWTHEITSKMVWECLDKLNNLGKSNKVIQYWVKDHVSVDGNEKADRLVKTYEES